MEKFDTGHHSIYLVVAAHSHNVHVVVAADIHGMEFVALVVEAAVGLVVPVLAVALVQAIS